MCLARNSRGYIIDPLSEEQLKELQVWLLERKEQLEAEPRRGLIPPPWFGLPEKDDLTSKK